MNKSFSSEGPLFVIVGKHSFTYWNKLGKNPFSVSWLSFRPSVVRSLIGFTNLRLAGVSCYEATWCLLKALAVCWIEFVRVLNDQSLIFWSFLIWSFVLSCIKCILFTLEKLFTFPTKCWKIEIYTCRHYSCLRWNKNYIIGSMVNKLLIFQRLVQWCKAVQPKRTLWQNVELFL